MEIPLRQRAKGKISSSRPQSSRILHQNANIPRGDTRPSAVITKFSSEEEALEMAHDTVCWLGAAIFTHNLNRAHRVARNIEAGMVSVISIQDDCDHQVPFEGVKIMGLGRS